MLYSVRDVWAARAPANSGLVWGEQGLDRRSHQGHKATSEEAPKGGGKLERSLTAGGVSSFLLWDPHAEIFTGPDGMGDV